MATEGGQLSYYYEKIEERRTDYGVSRWITTSKGQRWTHHECERRLKSAERAFSRWFSRSFRTLTTWNESDMNEFEISRLRYVLDDIQTYIEVANRELDRLQGVNRKEERIKQLRAIAGRTPEEAASYLAKADELEQEMGR